MVILCYCENMNIFLLLFICLLHGIYCLENSSYLTTYLNERAVSVGEKLIRHARNQENFHTVKFNNVNTMNLIGNWSTGEIFTIFNLPHALLDKELYQISRNNYTMIHKFDLNGKILLIKATQFKNLGFVAIATDTDILYIFGYHNNEIFKIQNVHISITDFSFFVHEKNLYMVIATPEMSSVILYKFTNTHFDEEEKFVTSNVSKLYTFDNNGSEIIVTLQKQGLTSSVYEFKHGKVRKIQKIDIKLAVDVVSYHHKGKRYLIIFSEKNNSSEMAVTNYLWTGSELLLWEKYTRHETLKGRKLIFYDDDTQYLLTSDISFNLLIYSLTNERISLIGDYSSSVNWTHVWTYDFVNHTNELLILAPTIYSNIEVHVISVSVQNNVPEKYQADEEKLSSCFSTLEKSAYALRSKLKDIENSDSNKLREAFESSSQLRHKEIEDLQAKHYILKATRANNTSQNLVFNTKVIINFPIRAKKVIAKDIRLEKINNKIWEPEHWMSYSLPQEIAGLVKTQILQVDNLETNKDDPIFNNLVLSKGNQILSGSVTVKNLKTTNLETMENQNGENLFGSFKTDQIFGSNFKISNLEVENINGINFDKFRNSVFRIGHGQTINGNITFENLETKEMIFDTIARKSNFLTTSTSQIINSSITIPKIFANNIKTNKINGIDFKNLAATLDDSVIEGPVSIKNLTIKNNLELKGNISEEFLQFNDTHIVGTNESDFLQRYNGKVKIRGNLILKNVDLGKLAKMYVFGEEFDPKIDQFWTKSTKQIIPTHFEAQNGITVPHLFTTFINDVNVNDYMLNSTAQKKSTKFYFDNVTIKGNVLLNPDEQHSPDLQRIQQDSVKVNGTFRIKGHKTYNNTLKVDKLEIGQLKSDSNAEEIIKNAYADFSGPNNFQKIIIRGDLMAKNLSTESFNNVNLKELAERTVYINKPQNISKLRFENITAKNIFVTSRLNQYDVKQLISKYQKIENITKISDVYVDKNVTIQNVQNLATINNKNVNDLIENNAFKSENHTISGNVNFSGNVTVKNLQVVVVNDIDLRKLTLRILYKNWDQTITEHFTFNILKTNNLIVDQINDRKVQNLIDVSSTEVREIYAPNGLTIVDPVEIQNLSGLFECDISDNLKKMKHPPTQSWDNVVVTGNVTFWDEETLINQILNKVLSRHNKKQIIKGKVTFVDNISVNNITAQKLINNVDLMEIVEDAFLNRPDVEQIITGKKIFSRIESDTLECTQNINVTTINDYDISEMNNKIVFKNSLVDVPIKGKKVFFGGLQTKRIETNLILGVEPQNLVRFDDNREIPNAVFESAAVGQNFNIEFINGMPLETLLNERLLKVSPSKQTLTGKYFFRNVYFNGNISSPRINDVLMEDLVYDNGVQNIESSKKFMNDLIVIGDVKTDLVNGHKMSEAYEKAVLKNEDTNFTGSLTIMKPALIEGNIETKYINNVPVDYMMETNANYSLNTEAKQIQDVTKIIIRFIEKYLNTTIKMPTELLYIEKSGDVQISLSNTISAQIAETKDDVLIHIESEEDGKFCGLPPRCKCPVQQTMQISSKHSVNVFFNKEMQRIYTYYDDHIMVHVITHSVSSNSDCRTNASEVMNEVSSIAWNVPPQGNDTGRFSVHRASITGYISDVKFFTIFGKTYIVIGIYYDPVLDTHNVNSLVLRFNEDKTAVEEVQKIPSLGIKTISLIPTAQGIILILGSDVSDQFNNTSTTIFRFNYENEQFELLRELPAFRARLADGVVLGIDSLIILANEQSTLHVLKYHEEFDNYYLYQSFQMDYRLSSISVFYAQGFGISDAYLNVVTTNNKYFIYSYQFIEGWKLEFSGEYDGLKSLVPFKLNQKSYLFAPSTTTSSLLTLVEHDSS